MEWQTILSIVSSACAIIFGYLAFSRNKKTDDANEGKKDGVVLTELGYIKSGVDDIKRKQERQDEHNTKFTYIYIMLGYDIVINKVIPYHIERHI